MCTKILANDLNNCLIDFDRKVLVTNLLDEYGGLLEDIAKAVCDFLSAEEAKGKKFRKDFILHGVQSGSGNEIITIVPENKLKHKKEKLEKAYSVLYSVETLGGSKSPPTQFVPLKNARVKLTSLEKRDVPKFVVKERTTVKKAPGPSAAPPKKQENVAPVLKSPESTPSKKTATEPKTGSLGAMFKKQEAATKTVKSPEAGVPKKTEAAPKSGTIGAMFKKQEIAAETKKTSPETSKNAKQSVTKPPTPRKTDEFLKNGEQAKKAKEEPAVNLSANLFEESSSSDDEEALDALKREFLTDAEDEQPSSSNKRRRIIDSEDEDLAPDAKSERRDDPPAKDVKEDANKSTVFMDDDGFVITVKPKGRKTAAKPIETKKEPKKTPVKNPIKSPRKKGPAQAAAKKQGNITNFFKKK